MRSLRCRPDREAFIAGIRVGTVPAVLIDLKVGNLGSGRRPGT